MLPSRVNITNEHPGKFHIVLFIRYAKVQNTGAVNLFLSF